MKNEKKDYTLEVARHFKQLQNKTNIISTVGIIKSVSPLTVSIMNGQITLHPNQLYVDKSLSDYNIHIDIDLGEGIEDKEIKIKNKLQVGNRVGLTQVGESYTFIITCKLQ